jgi:hypothetical protein
MIKNSYHKQLRSHVIYVDNVDHNLGVIKMGRYGGVVRSNCCENLRLSVVVEVNVHCYVSSERVNIQIGGTRQAVTVIIETKQTIT